MTRSSDYDFKINMEDMSLAHTRILNYVPKDATVLEAGCGRGNLTAYMRDELNCRVSIIEYSQALYDHAIQFAERGFCGSLEGDAWQEALEGLTFDVIMFADVLEHLRDPYIVLQRAVRFLKPDGIVIMSIPNVCHNDVIIRLLQNDFHYTQEGLLDCTHLHFFGLNNLASLLDIAGLQPVDMTYTFRRMFHSEQAIAREAVSTQVLDLLAQRPGGEIYQFIIKAKKKTDGSAPIEQVSLPMPEAVVPEILSYRLAYLKADGETDPEMDQAGSIPLNKTVTKKFTFDGVAVHSFHFILLNTLSAYLQNFSVKMNGEEVPAFPQNGSQIDSNILFDKGQPSFLIDNPSGQPVHTLEITLKVVMLPNANMRFLAKKLNQSKADLCALQKQYSQEQQQFFDIHALYELALTENEQMQSRFQEQGALLAQTKEKLRQMEQEARGATQSISEKLAKSYSDIDFMVFLSGQLREEIAKQTERANSLRAELDAIPRTMGTMIKAFLKKRPLVRISAKLLRHIKAQGLRSTAIKIYWRLKHHIKTPQIQRISDCLDYMDFQRKRVAYPQTLSKPSAFTFIDIVIPIYNGYELLGPLLESIARTKMPYRLILIDDCSPDSRILPFLEQYKKSHPHTVLMRNKQNLGFVGTVNCGLHYSGGHVALVNTDTELPENWLERLMKPIIDGDRIASSTPFTNSGTICSFPKFLEDSSLYCGLDLTAIDAAFAQIIPVYPVIPTGVGFCMGMHRDAIREIGVFDQEAYGRGYCEENDWCQRAIAQNWRHVIVENLFVYHKHGGSFVSEEKLALIEKNINTLMSRYPSYDQQIHDYCIANPLEPLRTWVQIYLQTHAGLNPVLVFTHNWGGGANSYLDDKYRIHSERAFFMICPLSANPEEYQFVVHWRGESAVCCFHDFQQCLSILPDTLDEIWVNELVSYNDLPAKMQIITQLASDKHAKLRFLLHDYFCICPSIVLLNHEGRYCAPTADTAPCEQCIRSIDAAQVHVPLQKSNHPIYDLRTQWKGFLEQCDVIEAFSNSSREILLNVYPTLQNVIVNPHVTKFLPPAATGIKDDSRIIIGILGVLQYQKGIQIVREMVSIIDREGLPVFIKLIGTSYEPIPGRSFSQTGPYQRDDLPAIIEKYGVDMILIASIWPETYSYTTDEAIFMGLPVASFDLGAPPERIRKYEKGLVISKIDAQTALDEMIDFLKGKADE